MPTHALAVDLGAESGRVMAGSLHQEKLTLTETTRFPTQPVWFDNAMRWNLPALFDHVLHGLRRAIAAQPATQSISVDAWGVDYVWTGLGQAMLSLPCQYRDPRVYPFFHSLRQNPGDHAIYAETGIQFLPFNTLYQFAADLDRHPALLAQADHCLFIADWFHAQFSGVSAAETSIASTSQLYHPAKRNWSTHLASLIDFPTRLLPPIVPAATILGHCTPAIRTQIGGDPAIIATCSHDTGAAVAAVPAEGENWAYLSSGTWSLIGLELPEPLLTPAACDANITNEIGVHHSVRFLKNIAGLWILQECRRAWETSGLSLSYSDLNDAADAAPPLRTILHPDHPPFLEPGDMPTKIVNYARATGQPIPETPGQFTRAILESLALGYRVVLDKLCSLTGRTVDTLHIVGGGSQSQLLNQFAATATGRRVVAGPVEATAIGNLLIQALARGEINDLAQLRAIVRNSFPLAHFEPRPSAAWETALARYQQLPITL